MPIVRKVGNVPTAATNAECVKPAVTWVLVSVTVTALQTCGLTEEVIVPEIVRADTRRNTNMEDIYVF